MRGHVDMDTVSQEFDDSRKQMDYSDSAENRIEELIVQKKCPMQWRPNYYVKIVYYKNAYVHWKPKIKHY